MSIDDPEHYKVVPLHCLNFFDALCTLFVVSLGVPEANPVMAWLIESSPAMFVLVKFIVLTYAVELLRKLSPNMLTLALALFMGVATWHIYGLMLLAAGV